MTIDDLESILITATQEHWATTGGPLLLSNLPSDLRNRGVSDYKSILRDKTLKGFAQELEHKGLLKVATHPIHLAKVALVPKDETYAYPLDSNSTKTKPLPQPRSGKTAAVRLLDILGNLDVGDLEMVTIPATVLVKLHKLP
ncbi:hypothetical protein [Pseudomonas sp. SCPG-7]|uniref:hypothetical protein n=1 Tax=Pseudomonas sp. SCPG-7 TaxID=1961714 RepID=UPI000A3873A2|nr:hypothetical protein [Pseudomonas sp. SCPG-7]